MAKFPGPVLDLRGPLELFQTEGFLSFPNAFVLSTFKDAAVSGSACPTFRLAATWMGRAQA